MAGFRSEYPAGFELECMAGFVGIRTKITSADAIAPVLAALSTNTLSKIVIGWVSGGRSFALRLIPGLILVITAAWAGAISTSWSS
ncbi:hypothetical protein HAP41_0000009625 [Bradyrhizobium barranii subsp. apii]|uniref:DUF4010 domain-containing protein n=1 Tax=Bradyrhizobium barranii subsp. apii TaxID=2819348 RepID=A0A8U0FRD1_9BRAD|nr:hypothetical protein [Bradyrhizobium barranii]UPT89207.1 hypothetical protein HAP41_0000009625 [Bradyrhizobium barranii subsp. apii]